MKSIPGYPDYAITSTGKVYSIRFKRFLGGSLSKGYLTIALCKKDIIRAKTFSVHRLVLETFIGPCPIGMEACHNNGIKIDNRLENLRWDNKCENVRDSIKHGTHVDNRGEKNGNAKLTEQDIQIIRICYKTGIFKQYELAEIFHTNQSHVSQIINEKRWKKLK